MFKDKINRQQQFRNIPKGRNLLFIIINSSIGWQDDDDTPEGSSTSYTKPPTNKLSFIKQKPSYQPQPPQQTQPVKQPNQSSFTLEEKLLDDILQPTGIQLKPAEHLLRDFTKRAKNFDKERIFYYLINRITPYKEYVNNSDKNKMLAKCLYVVEYLIEDKVDELYQAFEERQEMFEDIYKVYYNNKKIGEVVKHILKMFGNENVSNFNNNAYYANIDNRNNEYNNQLNQQQSQQSNVNLLDIGDDDNANTNVNSKPSEGNNNTIDLLNGIFGGNTNNNNVTTNIGLNNVIEGNNSNNNIGSSQGKGFSFIKSKSSNVKMNTNNNMNIQQQNEPPKKKGFDFIKAKSSSNQQQVHNNDFNSLFSNNAQPQQQNPIDMFNQNNQNTPLSSIFNTPNNNTPINNEVTQSNAMPTIDLTKITTTYNNNTTSNPQQPSFNYDLVYQNTEVLKPKTNQNDPFNFVDEMIKPKK